MGAKLNIGNRPFRNRNKLRDRAVARLRAAEAKFAHMEKADLQALVHELQVHQMELEIQNEELRMAQLELAQARDRYSLLYDCAPVGYITVNVKGDIVEANLTAASMLAVERTGLVGRNFSNFVERKDQDTWYLHRRTLLAGETPQNCELTLHKSDGTPLFLRLESRALGGETGSRCQIALIDIAKRKKVEEQLRQLTEDLEKRVEARTAELRDAQDQLRALGSRFLDLQEKERTQLARELHDEFGAALTALKVDLHWILERLPQKTSTLRQKGRAMSALIDNTVNSVRRTATLLRPRLLDDFGLVAAIEWQAKEFERRIGIRCKITLPEKFNLDPQRSTVLFRILQESLTNVARHAKATEVAVRLSEEGDKVRFEIEDNGIGIDSHAISLKKSLGLIGMRERAYAFGGEVHIAGRRGHGTTVIVEIPRHG
ncbi:MAG: ATP-binding protein [Alphaproteobacteria bacterium]